jgi:spore germination protein YaaH
MPSISISNKEPAKSPSGLEQFLDRRVLPLPVTFLTNRIVILATLALLIPLIFFSQDQPVVNALNSYLNVMSVVVSSTVLLYATIADVRDRAAAHRREEIAQEYQQVLEKRVQAEHILNEKILELAAQISLQGMQVARLEKIRSKDRKEGQDLARAYEQVLEKRVQEEHEINEKILAHAVQNSIQNVLVENLEKLRTEDREHAAGLARAYEQVLEQRVQAEHELNEKILQL